MSSKFGRRGVRPLKPPPVCRDKDIQKTPSPTFDWPSGSLDVEFTASAGMDFDGIDPGTPLPFPSNTTGIHELHTSSTMGAAVKITITLAIAPARIGISMEVTGGPFPGTYGASAPGWDGVTLPSAGPFDDQAGLSPWSGPADWQLT